MLTHYGAQCSRSTVQLFVVFILALSISDNVDGVTSAAETKLASNLGVRVLRPVYAVVPVTRDGSSNVTVVMTVWLKRVGATKGPYDMPHQAQDAVRMAVWVDNPTNLFQRTNGHLLLPSEHAQWSPTLSLETAHPGPVLPAALEPGPKQYSRLRSAGQRPYSYRVDLPDGVGECFKLVEASYPMHKHTICLPPAARETLCSDLAPPDVYTPTKPALYTVIGPLRHPQSSREWRDHYTQMAGRLVNYLSYHVAVGASGTLLYADELMRVQLGRVQPQLGELGGRGQLRLVEWDMPERSHHNTDGAGRPLGYNYDQALVASHALLGTSSCGTHLLLIITDLDEYVYFPRPGVKWPEPWGRCMAAGAGSGSANPIAAHRLYRYETVTSEVAPEDEAALWVQPGTLATRVVFHGANNSSSSDDTNSSSGGAIGGVGSGGVVGYEITDAAVAAGAAAPHPLARYDLVYGKPLPWYMPKQASLPASWVVLFWVHEGVPLRGRVQQVHHRCMALLHLPNAFRVRRSAGQKRPLETTVRPFRHWMFLDPDTAAANASLWRLS